MPENEKLTAQGLFARLYKKIGLLGVVSVGLSILILLGLALNLIFGSAIGWLAGVFVGGGTTALFVCGMIAVLKRTGIFAFIKAMRKSDIILAAAVALFIIVFYCVFMSMENYIYYWDYGSHWAGQVTGALDLIDFLFTSPVYAVAVTLGSINVVEYNSLISMIMAFPLFITGSTYFAYYLLVLVFFYLPSLFLFSIAVYRVLNHNARSNLTFGMVFGIVSLIGVGVIPILYGYVDAFCLLPAAAFISLVFKDRFMRKDRGDSVAAAFMLILTAIGRRYFLYLVIGFTAAVLLCGAAFFIWQSAKKQPVKETLKNFVYNMLVIAGMCLLLLLTVCIGFTIISLTGDYSFAYAAYQSGNLAYNFSQIFAYYGWIVCVFALFGIFFAYFRRRLFESGFMLVVFAFSASIFFLVQSMGMQHYYIVFFPIAYFVVWGVDGVYGFIKKPNNKVLKAAGCGALTLVLIFNFLCSTILGQTSIGQMLSTSSAIPKTRNDKEQLMALTDELYSLTENTDKTIYALGSGDVFNYDILKKLYMPAKTKIDSRLVTVPQVDLRDGFSAVFWYAGVFVTSSPCQYHLGEQNQRVISVLNDAILYNSPLSDNLSEQGSYTLDNGLVATVWERISSFDKEDGEYLILRFNEYYADYPQLFEDVIRRCM